MGRREARLIAALLLVGCGGASPDPTPTPPIAPPPLPLSVDDGWRACSEAEAASATGLLSAHELLGQRPTDGHPAFRGFVTSENERVRAAVVGEALLLIYSRADGSLRRVAVPRLPLVRTVEHLGADEEGRSWLLLSPTEFDPSPTALALVDPKGRLAERAVAPPGEDRRFVVHADGRLLLRRMVEGAPTWTLYTPGRGADLVRSR